MPKMRDLVENIRQHRTKLTVFNAIRQRGKATAPEIASKVEFSKPTVFRYLGEFVVEGLITEEGQVKSSTGKPPTLFSINPSAAFSVGIDFGAPDLTLALIDLAKNIIDRKNIPTEIGESPSNTAMRILEGIREIAHANGISVEDQLLGAAIGVPCCIDREAGLVQPIPRLPHWENVPLKAIIQRDIDLPVHIEVGTHLMALGEKTFGEREEVRNMLYIHVREGIGMGVFIDGRLFEGSGKGGRGIGHTIVSPGGPECICGRRGCLEVFAAEPAILKRARMLIKEKLTAQALFAAVRAGDTLAKKAVGEALDYLAIAVANAGELFNPEIIVLGGNIIQGGDFIIQHLSRGLEKIDFDCLKRGIGFKFSRLGIYAGALGAANLALEKAFEPLNGWE